MKKIFLVVGLLCAFAAQAQFPNTDSLHRYNNKWVRGTPVEAFSSLHLNTLLHGIIEQIDSAKLGVGGAIGVDTLYAINDSTVRYKKNGVSYNKVFKGVYDSRRKVDSVAMFNDSTLSVYINGAVRYLTIPGGTRVRKVNDSTLAINGDTVTLHGSGSGIANTKNPITKAGDSVALSYNTSSLGVKQNALTAKQVISSNLGFMRALATADLDTGYNYRLRIRGQDRDFYYDPNDAVTADDSAMTIVTAGGKRLKAITYGVLTPRMFGAKADGVTDDWWPIQKMYNYMSSTSGVKFWKVNYEGYLYYVSRSAELPHLLLGRPYVNIDGGGSTISTTTAGVKIFSRTPVDQDDASQIISDWKGIIHNFELDGNGSTGQKGLQIGATYLWTIENIYIRNMDTALDWRFSLGGLMRNVESYGARKVGMFFGYGNWDGGGFGSAAFNNNLIENIRINCYDGSISAISLQAPDLAVMNQIIVEGLKPAYEIYMDYAGSTLVQTNTIKGFHSETIPGVLSSNTVFKLRSSGTFNIQDAHTERTAVFFNLDSSGTNAHFNIKDFAYYQTADTPFTAKNTGIDGIEISGQNNALALLMLDPHKWKGNAVPVFPITYQGASNDLQTRSNVPWNIYAPGVAVHTGFLQNFGDFNQEGVSYLDNDVHVTGGAFKMENGYPFQFLRYGNTMSVSVASDSSVLQAWITSHGAYNNIWSKDGKMAWGKGFITVDDSMYNWMGSGVFHGSVIADQRSGYSTYIPLGNLRSTDWVTNGNLQDFGTSLLQNAPDGNTIVYTGNALRADTSVVATKTDVLNLQTQINNIDTSGGGTGIDTVAHGPILTGQGTLASKLNLDSLALLAYTKYKIDSLAAAGGIAFDGGHDVAGTGISITGDGKAATPHVISLSGSVATGNPGEVLNIADYSAVRNSSTNTNKSINVTAFNNMVSAAADGQRCIIPKGDWYFNDNLIISTANPGGKRVFIQQDGNLIFNAGKGVVIEGPNHIWAGTGNLNGGNTGGTDSTTYGNYSGSGIYLKNCWNCTVTTGKITNFRYGIKAGGESTTTPKGTQYCTVFVSVAYDNYANIYTTTTGTTDGTQSGDAGNWSNSNEFWMPQSGSITRGLHGTFGILVKKESGSNQATTNPFNYNTYHVGFEGGYYAIWEQQAAQQKYDILRWEAPQIATGKGIYLQSDNAAGLGDFWPDIHSAPINESAFSSFGIAATLPPLLDANGQRFSDFTFPVTGSILQFLGEEPFTKVTTKPFASFTFKGQTTLNQRYAFHKVDQRYGVDFYVPYELNDTTVAGNFTVPFSVGTVYVNSASATTITLPAASSFRRRDIKIKNISTGTVTVSGTATGSDNTLGAYEGAIFSGRQGSDWQNTTQTTPGGTVSTWATATPTSVNLGPSGVSGTGATISLASGSTNGGGRITITTGTSGGGFLLTGQLLNIVFGTANGSSTGPKVIFFPANTAAATLFQSSSVFQSFGSNTAGMELNGSGAALSTSYVITYIAVQ